jgi:RNA-directed DNA polymerase
MNKKPLREIFDAMYHGKYQFDDFLVSPIEDHYEMIFSKTGSGRRIFKPKPMLKVFHTFLNLFVFERLPLNERVVFSYRKGYSAINAVEVHSKSKYFYQTDIKAFFDSINSSLVRSTILAGLGSCAVSDFDSYVDRVINIVCVDDCLPVGFPSSAPLSNAVLYKFDNSLEEYCLAKGLIYTRYADDIILSGSSREALIGATEEIQRRLSECASEKLELNLGKTKQYQVGGKVKILGMMILPNGRVTPDSKRKNDLEVWLHYYQNDKKKFENMVKGADEQERLDKVGGLLNYMNSVDPAYVNKLRRKFGAATVDLILHRNLSS